MKILKLRFLMGLQRLMKNIKIYLGISQDTIIYLYYINNNSKNILLDNKDLFSSVYHYNHYIKDYNKKMEFKLTVKYLNEEKDIDIYFENKILREEDYRIMY